MYCWLVPCFGGSKNACAEIPVLLYSLTTSLSFRERLVIGLLTYPGLALPFVLFLLGLYVWPLMVKTVRKYFSYRCDFCWKSTEAKRSFFFFLYYIPSPRIMAVLGRVPRGNTSYAYKNPDDAL